MTFIKKLLLVSVLVLVCSSVHAQDIRLKYDNTPANKVLNYIKSTYTNISLSYDELSLSKVRVSADTVINGGVNAIKFVLRGLPFEISGINGVIVISPIRSIIKGTIRDIYSGERLPFTSVITPAGIFLSDENGNFNIKANTPTTSVIFSYLGYNRRDTTIGSGVYDINLIPSFTSLKEITIKDYETSNAMQINSNSGSIRINHLVAKYLPGNGDNSVFNLLRLMTGVRAAGEPQEISVWGSKPGESAIYFDGGRIFSMNGYNEQISAINPFMVKEIRLFKGGYGPEFGGQIGAIVDITGIDGKRIRPTVKLNINNQTANIFASAPLASGVTVSAAYRQTYFGLYSPDVLNPYGKRTSNGKGNSISSVFVTPDYNFKDLNLKISGDLKRGGRAFISAYGAKDRFSYTLSGSDYNIDARENNDQIMVSGGVSIVGKKGSISGLNATYSGLDAFQEKIISVGRQNYSQIVISNPVNKITFDVSHKFKYSSLSELSVGVASEINSISENGAGSRSNIEGIYIDNTLYFKAITIKTGLRSDYYDGRFNFQPRISGVVSAGDKLSFSAAWGIYRQYLGKVKVIYEDVAPVYVWKLLGENGYPVPESKQIVAGLSWNAKNFILSTEIYNRRNTGISQVVKTQVSMNSVIGSADISGIDLFSKFEMKGSQLFCSLTYSRMSEAYNDKKYTYYPAEFKTGGLVNLSPFTISFDYVYGEGYSDTFGTGKYSSAGNEIYNRFDISSTYTLKIYKTLFRAGVSILNLFNTENSKVLEIIPSGTQRPGTVSLLNLYSESIPFTPTLFLEFSF